MKITLDSIISGFKSVTKLIANFDAIESELNNKVLYRDNPDGEPNQMENDLDMNNNRITNLPTATNNTEPVTYAQWQASASVVQFTGTVVDARLGSDAAGSTFTVSEYTPGSNNLQVYLNGVLQPVSSYTEPTSTTVVMSTAPVSDDEYTFIINSRQVDTATVPASSVTFTQAGTGAVASNVNTKLQETVSVKDFGAVGDGVTDDTAAIQAAIDIGSKQVNFPEGTYSISSNRLFITSPVSLVGFNSAELIAADGLTYGSASTVGNGFIDVLDSVGVTFSGLTFTTLETSTISACVHFRGCSDVKVTGCTFNTPSNPNGSKCIIVQRSPNTPNYQVRNILVSGNIFNQSSNACLIIGDAATHPTNILIDGNIINGRDTVVYGSSIKVDKYTNNCVISNNTINGNGYGSEGITIEQGSHNCLVTGNTIHDCTDFGVKLTTDSADFAAAFDTITVSNNTIYSITSGSGYGIYMDSTGAVSDNITIKGNVITDVKSGIREAINNQTNLVITGNHINNPTTVGLSIQSNNTIVEGNIVKGGSSILSLSTSNSPTGLVVMNNIFEVDNGDSAISYSYGAAHSSDYVLRGNSGLRANSERANGTFTLAPDIAASEVYTSGGAVTSTLPDGSYAGQIKVIHGSISGSWNSSTVSVSNHETSSPEVFTLPVRTASVTLMWDTHKWVTLSSSGVTL